ncbi:MAG: peptide-methionine (S)-S-oxide reductase [Maricaulaceae bacterium]
MLTPNTDEIIGFGGGCHWCTEAVFQDLRGVSYVEQGFIRSTPPYDRFSEAVIVHFNPEQISLSVLTDIHLRTHASGANHSMRGKYRSAVYVKGEAQRQQVEAILADIQTQFDTLRVTQVLDHTAFKPSDPQFQNYYKTDPERPFCKTYIDPKLARIRKQFTGVSIAYGS